jgi:hypothetical protein
MPEFILDSGSADAAAHFLTVDEFTRGYVTCMFFTSTGTGDDDDLEHATLAELAPETWDRINTDCKAFQFIAPHMLAMACERDGYDSQRAGHDFWLTRNGHGAGFWDRSELEAGDLGDKLSTIARRFGSCDLYRGDDKLLYLA